MDDQPFFSNMGFSKISTFLVNSVRTSYLPGWKIHGLGENFLGRHFVLGELCIKKIETSLQMESHKKLTDRSDNDNSVGMRIWKHSRSVEFGGFPTDGFLPNRLIWYSRLIWAYNRLRLSDKEFHLPSRKCRRPEIDPWVGKIPWRRTWQATPVFLSGKFHGQRSLVGTVHAVGKNQKKLSTEGYYEPGGED